MADLNLLLLEKVLQIFSELFLEFYFTFDCWKMAGGNPNPTWVQLSPLQNPATLLDRANDVIPVTNAEGK